MSKTWMWGWELGTTTLVYTNSGWAIPNTTYVNVAATDPFQPAAGYGGGRYCLGMGNQTTSNRYIRTPSSGSGSIPPIQRFIFHTAYKRVGSTSRTSSDEGNIVGFLNGLTRVAQLRQVLYEGTVSPMALYVWDGATWVLQGTTTTTYSGDGIYKRIVFDMDGSTGIYEVYIDGILEISTRSVPSSETFAAVSVVQYNAGANGSVNVPSGAHDHSVMFDAGNHSTNELSLATIPTDTNTVTVGGQVYTFKTALTASTTADEVLIGASAALSRENLINAINLGPGAGTLYGSDTTLNAIVTAEEDATSVGIFVTAKAKGVETGACSETLAAGGDVWASANLAGGDLDETTDLALALGDIFIQGLLPNGPSPGPSPGGTGFLNVNGANDGTATDLYANVNDGQNLTDFIETVTSPDSVEFDNEDRADINAGWAPSQVHAVQVIQIARGSGAISEGRNTTEIPSLGKVTSDTIPLSAAGKMVSTLREWRTGNITTDVDGIKTGFEV
jgi:hypothetical protein